MVHLGEDQTAPPAVAEHKAMAKDSQGKLLPGSPQELRTIANEALKAGCDAEAVHLYTMAIDTLKGQPGSGEENLSKLNASSDGELAKLLSNRSYAYLRQGDSAAAVDDADACTRADPLFEKGFLRLAAALEDASASLEEQLDACERGLATCPASELLSKRKWRLKKALAARSVAPFDVVAARRRADDDADAGRGAAAAELGEALAKGTACLPKNLTEAERYLRLGAENGELRARRQLGVVLLELGRPAEAAEELREAAAHGDDDAARLLKQLAVEAEDKQREMRARLEQLAAGGDARAADMLAEFQAPEE